MDGFSFVVLFFRWLLLAFDNVPIENVLLALYDFVKTASGIKKGKICPFTIFLPRKVTSVPRFRVLDLVFLAHIQKR